MIRAVNSLAIVTPLLLEFCSTSIAMMMAFKLVKTGWDKKKQGRVIDGVERNNISVGCCLMEVMMIMVSMSFAHNPQPRDCTTTYEMSIPPWEVFFNKHRHKHRQHVAMGMTMTMTMVSTLSRKTKSTFNNIGKFTLTIS